MSPFLEPFIPFALGAPVVWLALAIGISVRRYGWKVTAIVTAQIALWLLVLSVTFLGLAGLAGVPGVILWCVAVVTTVMAVARYRVTERQALVGCLAVAAKQGLPLSVAAEAFADERRGKVGRSARRLGRLLDQGLGLQRALAAARIRLPADAHVALAMGLGGDNLDAALRESSTAHARIDPLVRGVAARVVYLIAFVLFASVAMIFFMYKIVPEYVKIFDGFGLALPPLTLWAIRCAGGVVDSAAWLLIAQFLAVLCLLLVFSIARYAGIWPWDPPVVRRLWRRLDRAVILRSLGQAVERRQSLPAAIAALGDCHPQPHLRSRLRIAYWQIDGGADWRASLSAAGLLGAADAGVLGAAERAGNLGWAMREMADRQVRAFTTRLSALLAIAYPLLIIAAAIVVMIFTVGMFLPLVTLINSLV